MRNNLIFATLFMASLADAQVLSFSKAYEMAVENSHQIRSSLYQLEANKQKIVQEKSAWYPQINFTASHRKTEFEINHLQHRDDYDLIENSTDLSLLLKQTVYDPAIDGRIDIENLRIKLNLAQIKLQKQDLAKKVLQIYLNILSSKNKINLYNSRLKFNRLKLKAISKKYEMQLANKMELFEIKVDINTLRIDLQKEQEMVKLYRFNLEHLIGEFEQKLPEIDLNRVNLNKIELMSKIVTEDEKFLSNIKIKQAIISKNLSKKEIRNSSMGHLPKISLNASYNKFISEDAGVDYENTKKIMLEFRIPLYQGGYVESKILSAKLQYSSASEDFISVKKEIQIEYEQFLLSFNSAKKSITLYKEAMASAKLYLDSISQGFKNGLKSSVDLEEAQNRVNEVEYKYVENLYDIIESYAKLLILSDSFENLNLIDEIVN